MEVHQLKIRARYFVDIQSGVKTAEIRYAKDRDFNVGDLIEFAPVNDHGVQASCVRLTCEITHIVRGGHYGIHEDYDMLSIKLIKDEVAK